MITVRLLALAITLAGTASSCVAAGAAAPALTAAVAERMTTACIDYAAMRRGAVNIWIYDRSGEVLHFERMDGAPPIGAPPGTLSLGSASPPFGTAIDPNGFAPADAGDVPVAMAAAVVGRVRVAGMGATGDVACARAAAAAAK